MWLLPSLPQIYYSVFKILRRHIKSIFAGSKFVQNPFFFFFHPVSDAEPLRVKEYDIEGYIISYSRW